jgi:hypothetical protein
MSAQVEIREDDGGYTAIDEETGTTGQGETRAIALATLAVRLHAGEEDWGELDSETALRLLSTRVGDRFEAEGVTEDDVGAAIAWARSES